MQTKTKKPYQPRLDTLLLSDHAELVDHKVTYNAIHVSQATFKAGLAARVHRWFRLTPSFGPDLVREMLSALKCEAGDVVLDPFAGAGTTMIECQLEGYKSYGFEINPFLHFVGNTCLHWDLNTTTLRDVLNTIHRRFVQMDSQIEFDTLSEYGLSVPPIHNPIRWWRADILKQLLVLKSCADAASTSTDIKNFFRLALAGVLVPDLTNVTLGRLQLHFIDRSQDDIRVLPTFMFHANQMIDDLNEIQKLGLTQTSTIISINSTDLKNVTLNEPISCVITSPPYPNRYSYVWNTRPHLYFFDFLMTPTQASDIDKVTIGGTWGTATSILSKDKVRASFPIVNQVVGGVVEEIRKADNLMANYAMKYFNMLAQQIVEMDRLLATGARVAYVVGCSRLKGVYIETDVILGKIFEGLGLGYSVSAIERIRRRNSGKDLHESIVYAWKGVY